MKRAKLLIVAVVAVAVILVGAVFVISSKRSSQIEQWHTEAQAEARYKKSDAYYKGTDEDKAYLERLFVAGAAGAKQSLSGTMSLPPGKALYYTTLYQGMVDQAKKDGKTALARSFHIWVIGQGYVDTTF